MTKEISLKVLEAYTRDVGRGVCRIDFAVMDKLNCKTGDVVEIIGKKKTVAKCLPIYPSDEGKGLIRIDGLVRENVKADVGTKVKICVVEAKQCVVLTLVPLEAIPPIDERYIVEALEGVPVLQGDKAMIPYFGGRITFLVRKVEPEGAVVIIQKTICKLVDEPTNTETFDFEDIITAQKQQLVTQLKEAIKETNAEQITTVIEKFRKLDMILRDVRDILSGFKLKESPYLTGSFKEILEEAIQVWIDSKKKSQEKKP